MVSIVCQVEGWVVRKGPCCEQCYWYEPGSEKDTDSPEPAYFCKTERPMRELTPDK